MTEQENIKATRPILKYLIIRRILLALTMTVMIIVIVLLGFRFFYFSAIQKSFPLYQNLDFLYYLYLCCSYDIIIALFFTGVSFIIICLLHRMPRMMYVLLCISTGILIILLIAALGYFSLFETTVQFKSVTKGMGKFSEAIVSSAYYELPDYLYVLFISAVLICILIFTVIYKVETRKTGSAFLWPVFVLLACLFTCAFYMAPEDEQIEKKNLQLRLYKNARMTLSLNEILENPIEKLLIFFKEENKEIKWQINEDFTFGFNTNSLISREAIPRLSLPRGKKYNIILYFFESTCQHYLEEKINGKPVTPVWQRLSRNAFVSPNHYTHYPLSITTRISVVSSTYELPSNRWLSYIEPDVAVKSVTEILKENGYRTGLFYSASIDNFATGDYFKNRSLDVSLDYYSLKKRSSYKNPLSWAVDDRAMIEPSIDFMKKDPSKPFIAIYIPVAPHYPYVVPDKTFELIKPAGSVKEQRRQRYMNSLYYSDYVVGELIKRLEEENLADDTLVFLFADHGEALDQHRGNYLHALCLYEENVRTPFIIYNKKLFPYKHVYQGISRHIDVLPTILDLLNIPKDEKHEGISLFSSHPVQLALLHAEWTHDYIGLRDHQWKYIYRLNDGFEELYNIIEDRWEQLNVLNDNPEISTRFRTYILDARNYIKEYYARVLKPGNRSKM